MAKWNRHTHSGSIFPKAAYDFVVAFDNHGMPTMPFEFDMEIPKLW